MRIWLDKSGLFVFKSISLSPFVASGCTKQTKQDNIRLYNPAQDDLLGISIRKHDRLRSAEVLRMTLKPSQPIITWPCGGLEQLDEPGELAREPRGDPSLGVFYHAVPDTHHWAGQAVQGSTSRVSVDWSECPRRDKDRMLSNQSQYNPRPIW